MKKQADSTGKTYKVSVGGTYFHSDTPDDLIALLEMAHNLNYYVWFRYGDKETGRDWLDDCDVCGFLGRSMGPTNIPLLLPTRRSIGGGGILDHCIVKLFVHGGGHLRRWVAENYQKPDLVIFKMAGERSPWRVKERGKTDEEYVAGFPTQAKAERWRDFITGARLNH